MSRRIDEDTIRQLLLDDISDEENCSESEKEDHLEADPAYETDGEEDISSVTEQPPSTEDIQASTSSSIEDPLPSTSGQPHELIIIPTSNILRGKDKHKWSSVQPSSRSRTPSRNIVHIRPGPTRNCKNGTRDSITAILNMPGTSSSTSTHEIDQREDAVSLPIDKKRKICAICPSKKRRMTKSWQQILVWRTQT